MKSRPFRFLIDQFSREDWQGWLGKFSSANLYQCWDYGEAHAIGLGRSVSRIVLLQDEVPVAMAQFRIKQLPLVELGTAEADWGPLFKGDREVIEEHQLKMFLDRVVEEYYGSRRLSIKLELPGLSDRAEEQILIRVMEGHGFRHNPARRAYRTVELDLSRSLETLRANLDGKWRNCLKLAEKAGLEAEFGSSVAHFDRFMHLYNQMQAAKPFPSGVRLSSVRNYQSITPQEYRLLVCLVRDAGRDVAAGVFSVVGQRMLYFLGATSPSLRKNCNPGYLVQWLTIERAIASGFRSYDLGGLTDIPGSGVDLFKLRMGGVRLNFPGWYEFGTDKLRGTCFDLFERFHRKSRRAVSKLSFSAC